MYDGLRVASGTDHFNLLDELQADEVRALCKAQTFVDEEALPLLGPLAVDDSLPRGLATRVHALVLEEIVPTGPVASGLVVLELCRGDVRLWDSVSPALPQAPGTRAWAALGHATGAADTTASFWANEAAVGNPHARSRRVRNGLDRLAEDIAAMQLVCLRLGRLLEQGAASARTIELAVRHNVRTSVAAVGLARGLLSASAARSQPVTVGGRL